MRGGRDAAHDSVLHELRRRPRLVTEQFRDGHCSVPPCKHKPHADPRLDDEKEASMDYQEQRAGIKGASVTTAQCLVNRIRAACAPPKVFGW
jgi:hypothetical protein